MSVAEADAAVCRATALEVVLAVKALLYSMRDVVFQQAEEQQEQIVHSYI